MKELSKTLCALYQLNQLKRVKAPTHGHLQAAKEQRYGKTKWVSNPIKQVAVPKEILEFKALSDRKRVKKLDAEATVKRLKPSSLVTKQVEVAEKGVENFILDPKIEPRNRVIILAVGKKNFIWNGNHRCVAALLRGETIKTTFLRLK